MQQYAFQHNATILENAVRVDVYTRHYTFLTKRQYAARVFAYTRHYKFFNICACIQ